VVAWTSYPARQRSCRTPRPGAVAPPVHALTGSPGRPGPCVQVQPAQVPDGRVSKRSVSR
jgi:hypothetical protein